MRLVQLWLPATTTVSNSRGSAGSQASRDDAAKILRRLSEQNVQSADFDSQLESLAGRLLCKRWHQSQNASKVDGWKSRIETFRAAETARQASRVNVQAVTESESVPATTPCLAATLDSLRRDIATLNERYADALQLATSAAARPSNSPQSVQRVDSSTLSPPTRRGTSNAARSSATPPRAVAEPEVAQPLPAQESSEQEEAHSPISRASTLETQSSGADSEAALEAEVRAAFEELESPAADLNPDMITRHPAEGNCPICCEELGDQNDLSWCRARCGQNFHTECVDTWLAVQADAVGEETCPNW